MWEPFEQDGKTFIVSLRPAGGPITRAIKWSDTKKLMTYGLEHYSIQDVLIRELPAAQLEVLEGQHGGRLSEEAVVPLSHRCDMEQQSLKVLLGADEEVQVEKSLAGCASGAGQSRDSGGEKCHIFWMGGSENISGVCR